MERGKEGGRNGEVGGRNCHDNKNNDMYTISHLS